MSVAGTVTRRCPACGARVGRGSRDGDLDDGRCPACGRVIDRNGVSLFPLSGNPGPVRVEGEVRTGPTTGRGNWLLLGIVLLALVALAARSCSTDEPEDAAQRTTTTATATSTPNLTPTPTSTPGETSSAPATSDPTFPPRVALPDGMLGELAVVTKGGDLYRIDLATGTVRKAPTSIDDIGFSGGPVGVAVFGDRTLVVGAERGVVLLVAPDGTVQDLDTEGEGLVGAGPGGAVLRSWSTDRSEVTVVDPTGAHATFPIPTLGNVVGVAQGQPVVEVLGRIGRLDPSDGQLNEVASGRALAANDWGLARAVCPTMERCELRSGPWDDLDARAVPLPAALWFESVLDPTGRRLAVIAQGGNGPPRRMVVDLRTGEQVDVGDITSSWQLAFTLDGDHVVLHDDEELTLVRLTDGQRVTFPAFPFDVVGFAVG